MLILLTSVIAGADSRVHGHTHPFQRELLGHTHPFQRELLENPITLKCGAVIREWRGSPINKEKVEKLCTFTKVRFFPFMKSKGFNVNESVPFTYSLSFIPNSSQYRDLNDSEYRFSGRSTRFKISGYTLNDVRYAFNLSNTYNHQFNVSLVHELFHALSFHYDVNGPDDEILAEEFTMKYMGLK